MLAVFVNELQSNLRLNVDASRLSSRKLRWELIDRSTEKVRLSVPFWESQTEGQPLRVAATYRAAHENYTFIRVLRKLAPVVVPKRPDGRSYVMNRLAEPDLRESTPTADVQGDFRAPVLDWKAIEKQGDNERWNDGYERAVATGKPVIINNRLLVVPQDDTVGRACANPGGRNCDFARSFVSDIGVLTVGYQAAYKQLEALRSPGTRPLERDMVVNVVGRTFGGQLFWAVGVKPKSLPAPYQMCADFSLACYFYPKQATTTAQELVIRGVFGQGGSAARQLPPDEYELVVPLAKLPTVARVP